MNARQSQIKGRARLRALAADTATRGFEMESERERFLRLADPQAAPRVVSSFNLFPTPQDLAAEMAGELLRGRALGRWLEPSAGTGRLYTAARAHDGSAPAVLVEIAAECAGELYRVTAADPQCQLLQRDFLGCDPSELGQFESVLMNPPFCRGSDLRHIKHARRFLAPGGRLVSLLASGPRQRAALQDSPLISSWRDLGERFKSEGTRVSVAMVTIDN
jgi:predicted RNA methylase